MCVCRTSDLAVVFCSQVCQRCTLRRLGGPTSPPPPTQSPPEAWTDRRTALLVSVLLLCSSNHGAERPRLFLSPGPASSLEAPPISPTPAGSSVLYQDPLAPAPLMHLPYEAPPPPTYLSAAPPLPSHSLHPAHLPHHQSYHPCLPPSAHWGALPAGGQAPRLYCPAPNPPHVVGYITTPPPHHPQTHYIPPTI